MAEVEVLLLGPLEVRRHGEIVPLGGANSRRLLADLVLHAGQVLSVDRLIDDVWGERPPPTARHAVEVYVSKLRPALGTVLTRRTPGYLLDLAPDRVDAGRFALRAAEGAALVERDPHTAGAILREALALWRGPALADFTFEPFAQADIARLEEQRQQCLEARLDADLAAGRGAELVAELEALTRDDPFRERLRAQLMLALYRAGRARDALDLYRATRRMLHDELAIEPGPELRSLEAAILRGDEALLGAAPARAAPPPARRGIATVVVLELAPGGEPTDAEVVHAFVAGWHGRTAEVVSRHGGTVVSADDRSVVATFGVPAAREDDPLRAARAALELVDPRLRIGVETGELVADGTLVTGLASSQARIAAQQAAPGTVRLGPQAATLLTHAARLDKRTARLLSVVAGASAFERRLEVEIVGRAAELAVLRQALDAAVGDAACRVVHVVGAPGIGKTRLAHELMGTAGDRALCLHTACSPDESASGYEAIASVVRAAAGSVDAAAIRARGHDEAVAVLLAAALGERGGASSPPEVAWAFRRFCERLTLERPLVLVLDDLQWATETMLELVEHLVTRARGPLLALCISRDELLEEHPSFLVDSVRVELGALAPREAEELLDRLLGRRPLSVEVQSRILASAEGNPLFVEQLLTFVAEEGTLVDRPLPPTIQSLLAARLDRLGPGERAVLARAAVIGREFTTGELAALLDTRTAATAEAHVETLTRRGFLRGSPGGGYRFRHSLVQQSAYGTTAKAERADLHERFADHLTRNHGTDEIVGLHLERAYALLAELGADDRHLRQLAADAGTRLGAAGILAWKRNDAAATVGLLRRATELLDPWSAPARELTCELGLAFRASGDAASALAALELARRPPPSGASPPVTLRAELELALVRLVDGQASADRLLELAETAVPTFQRLDDDRALGRAWLLSGYVHGSRHLRCGLWQEHAELALVHYERAGWPAATCLGQIACALYLGSTPADDAAARCATLLAETPGPAGEANVLVFLGGLAAMLGGFEEGRAHVARARAILDDLGQVGLVASTYGPVAAGIEVLAGELGAAERMLRESAELLETSRLTSTLASRAGELAAVLYLQEDHDNAAAWTLKAEEWSSSDDLDARLSWQPVRAKLIAVAGDRERAERLAREAVALAGKTDALNIRARVQLDLAEVLRAAGRDPEAAEAVERARADYERKGNRSALERLGVQVVT